MGYSQSKLSDEQAIEAPRKGITELTSFPFLPGSSSIQPKSCSPTNVLRSLSTQLRSWAFGSWKLQWLTENILDGGFWLISEYQMAGDASFFFLFFFSLFLTRNSSSCNCIHYKMFLTSCLSHKWLCLLSIHVMRIPKAPSFSYNYWLKFSSRKIAFISKAIAANLLLRVENITSLFNFSTTLKHRQ